MKKPFLSQTLILIALSTALLGFSIFLMGHHKHIELITDFYRLTNVASPELFNLLAAIGFIGVAMFSIMSLKEPKYRQVLGYLLIVLSVTPLLALFDNSMWLKDLGGFPAIGSGQGVIKYFALLSIGILLVSSQLSVQSKRWISALPVIIVLAWIGGMKFTLFEAQGIETLVKGSPLMAWMYDVWDLQTTSNIIGVYDLIAVVLLILGIYKKQFVLPAVLMAGSVMLVTQSFLLTWEAALSADTLLSTGGHFLIKDIWFIANLACYWSFNQNAINE